MGAQNESSFRRRMRLRKLIPQVCSGLSRNRSVLKGMAISVCQPLSVRRVSTNQTPSQSRLNSRPSLKTCPSNFAPAGLVSNM